MFAKMAAILSRGEIYRIIYRLPLISTFVVPIWLIRQHFSRVTQSRVKIIGESPHEWPRTSLLTAAHISFHYMKTPIDRAPFHCCGILTSRKYLLWRHFGISHDVFTGWLVRRVNLTYPGRHLKDSLFKSIAAVNVSYFDSNLFAMVHLRDRHGHDDRGAKFHDLIRGWICFIYCYFCKVDVHLHEAILVGDSIWFILRYWCHGKVYCFISLG